MNGTGAVEIGGGVAYVYFTGDGRGGLAVRLSADEWDRFGLHPGQWVRVRLPGREAESLLLTAATQTPPVVWVTLVAAAAVAGRRVG